MNRKLWAIFAIPLATILLSGATLPSAAASQAAKNQRDDTKMVANIVREVRHQLVMLPYYSVFDNLTYSVDGDTVTLSGQVIRPTLKSDAESAVKSLEAVRKVVNNIEVLPVSPADDDIRRAVFRAVYGDATLQRYAVQAVPSIHIVVKNGNVALEGVVDNETDKSVAYIKSSGVPSVFSVKNNLVVAGEKGK